MYDKKQSQIISKLLKFSGVLISWIVGVFFIIGGLISLSNGQVLGGLIIMLGATLIIPPVKSWVKAETKKNIKDLHFIILAAVLIVVGLIFTATGTGEKQTSTTVQTLKTKAVDQATPSAQPTSTSSVLTHRNVKISDDVYTPYDAQSYPKLTKKYKSRLAEIQDYRVKAAEMVLASGKCDQVSMSDLSDESTVKKLKFFVDCSSGKQGRRFYLTESEINENTPVVAQDEKGVDESEAVLLCKKEIEAKTSQYPKVTTHEIAGTVSQKFAQSGRVEVHMDFEITNFYGVEIPYIGHCFFDENGNGTIKINRRSGAS